MRAIVLFSFLAISLWSCNADEDSANEPKTPTAAIQNLTSSDLEIRLNNPSLSASEFIFVDAYSDYTASYSRANFANGPQIMFFELYDSIEVFLPENEYKKITFYPDSSSFLVEKNVYDSADWVLQNDTITFLFTEEDLAAAR